VRVIKLCVAGAGNEPVQVCVCVCVGGGGVCMGVGAKLWSKNINASALRLRQKLPALWF
jgi:hypothetical protein